MRSRPFTVTATRWITTRLAEAERTLAQHHRDYSELLTSAIKGFPV